MLPKISCSPIFFTDHFNIYTREAGAGSLSVAVEGPSKAQIKIEERPHGFLGVSYKVDKPGTCTLIIIHATNNILFSCVVLFS